MVATTRSGGERVSPKKSRGIGRGGKRAGAGRPALPLSKLKSKAPSHVKRAKRPRPPG